MDNVTEKNRARKMVRVARTGEIAFVISVDLVDMPSFEQRLDELATQLFGSKSVVGKGTSQ